MTEDEQTKEKADRERGEAISRGVQDYVDANPGMSHTTAYSLLKHKRPQLFTDESGRGPLEHDKLYHANQKREQSIRDEIKKMQDADKDLPFTVAWNRLKKQRPDLFDFTEPKARPRTEPEPLTGSNPC